MLFQANLLRICEMNGFQMDAEFVSRDQKEFVCYDHQPIFIFIFIFFFSLCTVEKSVQL